MGRILASLRTQTARRFALFVALWLFAGSALQFVTFPSNQQCPTAPVQVVPIVLRNSNGQDTGIQWRAPLPGEKSFQLCTCSTVKRSQLVSDTLKKFEPYLAPSPVLLLNAEISQTPAIPTDRPALTPREPDPPTPPPNLS